MGITDPTSPRLRLRDLPLAARLVLSAFLISVGLGYLAALVQLHLQHATPGNLLPTGDDAVRIFHGAKSERPKSKIEVLIEAPEDQPFNGSGQMSAAFTTKGTKPDWDSAVDKRAEKLAGDGNDVEDRHREQAEKELRAERDGERRAVVAWIRDGAKQEEYDRDAFALPRGAGDSITPKYLATDAPAPTGDTRVVRIASILNDRCARCHKPDSSSKAKDYPLDKYAGLKPYVQVTESSTAMSTEKLAQTTHAHLLSFSMLYALTGLIFAFSSYPGVVRALIAPLPLVAQVADISCWWLARLDPFYAHVIVFTGAVVAAGLMLQIVLSLFSMYGKGGKAVLLLLLVAAGLVGWQAKERYIDPYLAAEKPAAAAGQK